MNLVVLQKLLRLLEVGIRIAKTIELAHVAFEGLRVLGEANLLHKQAEELLLHPLEVFIGHEPNEIDQVAQAGILDVLNFFLEQRLHDELHEFHAAVLGIADHVNQNVDHTETVQHTLNL